jgi:Flp pilus assembly protein TadB
MEKKKFKDLFLSEPMNTMGDLVGQDNLPWILFLIAILILWFIIENIKAIVVVVIAVIIIRWCVKRLSKLNEKRKQNNSNPNK